MTSELFVIGGEQAFLLRSNVTARMMKINLFIENDSQHFRTTYVMSHYQQNILYKKKL